MKKPRTPESVDTEELIRSWADKSNLEVREARVLWQILCGEMAEHLAAQFKSVDFGFCVVHACPYRTNWKNFLIMRYPFLSQWIRGKSAAERNRIINEAGVPVDMQDAYILAVRNGVAYIGLEISPRKSWWRYSLSIQKKLLASAGPVGYCRLFGRVIHKLKDRLLESYLAHLAASAIPCGKLASGRYYAGQNFLVPNRERKKVRPSSVPVRLSPLYQPNSPSEILSSGVAEDLVKSHQDMLPMPGILQEKVDVRQIDVGGDGE